MEIGVDVLETDVHMSADGVVVVSHDEDGTRAAGKTARIADTPLAELRTWDVGRGFIDGMGRAPYAAQGLTMPTLEELLDRFPDARLNIDIKQQSPPMVDAFLSVLQNHHAQDRITLASFHADVIAEVRKRFTGPTVLAQREVIALLVTPLWLLRRTGVAGNVVQVPVRAGPFELGSRAFIDKCHALGLRIDFWTVNDPIVADILLDRGADGMITDDPARLKPLFDERR